MLRNNWDDKRSVECQITPIDNSEEIHELQIKSQKTIWDIVNDLIQVNNIQRYKSGSELDDYNQFIVISENVINRAIDTVDSPNFPRYH